MRLIVHRASIYVADNTGEEDPPAQVDPGHVAIASKKSLVVQTADGLLSINDVQPAGKRAMPVEDFLRGKPPEVGDRFGS